MTAPVVTQLGYLGFEVKDLAAWEKFATEVLGLGVSRRFDGGFSLRHDDHEQRFIITEGPADDLSVVGFQVADQAALDGVVARLKDRGIDVVQGSPEQAASRGVKALVRYVDPGGIPSEVFHGPTRVEPFVSTVARSGFVAGDAGLGHLVLSAGSQQESRTFYEEVLGFKLSDRIACEIHGFKVDILFFHVNERHHSIAFGERQKKRLHHFMLEVRSIDDVGMALDRTLKSGLRIMQTLGRHPNDKMLSFYAKTPSGFQFEYGFGGRLVNDATWEPTTYDHISEWGHMPPEFVAPRKEERR